MCSHDLIFRTNKESSIWRQNNHRDIMQNLSAPLLCQEECRTKVEHDVIRVGILLAAFLLQKSPKTMTRLDYTANQIKT